MRKPLLSFVLLCCLCLFTSVSLLANNAPSYIERFKDIAISEMHRSGVPASITLAQAIIESGWGNGEIARNSNNYFGIKCKDYWQGPAYYAEDDDVVNGKLIKSCFRAYDDIESSFKDHSDFLRDNPRYNRLFALAITDYKGWAKGLKECGYATNEAYAELLIGKIEQYGLYKYDTVSDPTQQVPTVTITKPNQPAPNHAATAAAPGFVIPGFPTSSPTTPAKPVQSPSVSTPAFSLPVETEVVSHSPAPIVEIPEENYEIPEAVALPDDYERGSKREAQHNFKPLYLGSTPESEVEVQVSVKPEVMVEEPYEAIVPEEDFVENTTVEVVVEEEAPVTTYEDVYTADEPMNEPAYTPVQAYQQPLPANSPAEDFPVVSPTVKPEAIIRMSYSQDKNTTQLSRRPRVSSNRRR